MDFVTLSGIAKSYDDRGVLRNLNLSVRSGEVYGLLGANGAGKSTTINIMTGLVAADRGTVLIDGCEPERARRSNIGIVPQDISLYRTLTCRENLRFFAGIYGLRGAARTRRVDDVVAFMGLREYADTRVSELSGGWKRRLNLSIGIVHHPALLVLDEPSAGMDVESRIGIWELVRELKRRGGTILLTTHLLEEAEALCDRVGILHDGRIVTEGTVAELVRRIPAVELAEIEAGDQGLLISRAGALGLEHRKYGPGVTLLLPQKTRLVDLLNSLEGVPIRSARLREVGLSQVYLEAVGWHWKAGVGPPYLSEI